MRGLNLLNGPGNDMAAVTNLAAAGCHLILFTTGARDIAIFKTGVTL